MKNIARKKDDFQNFGETAAERINKLTAAIKAAPGDALNLLSDAIKAETDSAVKNWLIRFREAFEPLATGGAANV